MKQPTIKTCLLDRSANKETLTTILKTSALETIDSYPTTSIHTYTDGSAFKATTYAGYGVHLRYPDGSTHNYSAPCGNICSNYEAEVIAMKTAIELIHQQMELGEIDAKDVIVFTDSKSALQALEERSIT
jgi:ribonuclease HI